jgi:hypothetical protein
MIRLRHHRIFPPIQKYHQKFTSSEGGTSSVPPPNQRMNIFQKPPHTENYEHDIGEVPF